MLEVFAGFVAGFLSQTEIVSHVTRRLVEAFGRRSPSPALSVVVEVRNVPGVVTLVPSEDLVLKFCLSPPPEKLLLVDGRTTRQDSCIYLGALIDGESPRVSWIPVQTYEEILFEGPLVVVGLITAEIVRREGVDVMQLLQVKSHGEVLGCTVTEILPG